MSIDPKYGRYCDECGRTIMKAHRIFEGKDYCAICYPRVFVAATCVKCGKSARVHKRSNEAPVCRACARIGRLCVRCEKPILKAGMLSAGKPVCPSCVPHFRVPLPCAACGKLSARLSALPSLGIDEKMCDSCRTKVTHKTCSICRKYRKVAGVTADKRPFCVACQPGAAVTHRCPDCNVEMPGNGAARCRSCLNWAQVLQEVNLSVHTLTRPWVKTLYRQFAEWVYRRQPDKPNLVASLRTHHLIFERLDVQFTHLQDVTVPALLETFGVAELRKHLLVSQFLSEAPGLAITPELKAESAELERIRGKLAENRKYPWGKTLEEFAACLLDSGIPTRTRRLYLATAEGFCHFVKLANVPWSEEDMLRFLRAKPGARANLFKFVGYCSRTYGWHVRIPPRSQTKARSSVSPKTVSYLRKLLRKVATQGIDNVDQGTLARIIAKSLGFPIHAAMGATHGQFSTQSGQIFMEVGSERVHIPPELEDIARAYIVRISTNCK